MSSPRGDHMDTWSLLHTTILRHIISYDSVQLRLTLACSHVCKERSCTSTPTSTSTPLCNSTPMCLFVQPLCTSMYHLYVPLPLPLPFHLYQYNIYLSLSIYIYIYVYIYIYIYICICTHMYIYIYIYIYAHMWFPPLSTSFDTPPARAADRRSRPITIFIVLLY